MNFKTDQDIYREIVYEQTIYNINLLFKDMYKDMLNQLLYSDKIEITGEDDAKSNIRIHTP